MYVYSELLNKHHVYLELQNKHHVYLELLNKLHVYLEVLNKHHVTCPLAAFAGKSTSCRGPEGAHSESEKCKIAICIVFFLIRRAQQCKIFTGLCGIRTARTNAR